VTLHPVDAESLADGAYRRISEALLSGALKPGARLVMDTLAAQLEISRTPVRDALRRLEREGLIEPTGRRGYIVRPLNADEIHNLYEVRTAVEVYAAQRVAELGGTAVSHVADAVRRAEAMDLKQPAEAFAANRLVHRAVVEATGNELLVGLFDGIWTRAMALLVYSSYFQLKPDHHTIRELHQPLLDAFEVSPQQAAEVMRRHINEGLEATLR
jgi:DNA-binding GntR family transcriptional regulator